MTAPTGTATTSTAGTNGRAMPGASGREPAGPARAPAGLAPVPRRGLGGSVDWELVAKLRTEVAARLETERARPSGQNSAGLAGFVGGG